MTNTYNDHFQMPVNAERVMLTMPANVIMSAHLSGDVDPDALRQAIERLRERHALLAVRVEFAETGEAHYVTAGVPAVPLRIVDGGQKDQVSPAWVKEVTRESQTAFDLKTGPLVRFTLVRSIEGRHLLVIGHHSICDGKSLSFLLRDVLSTVAAPHTIPERLPAPPPIDETTVPNPKKPNWLARFVLGRMSRKWEQNSGDFEANRERLHETFWAQNTGARTLAWGLSKDDTANLVARCRQEQVTVNDALWAAFLSAQQEVQGTREKFRKHAGMAVSTRDRLNTPVGEVLGFYASSLRMKLSYNPRLSFWENARCVHRSIHRELDKTDLFRMLIAMSFPPSLLDSLYFQKYGLLDDSTAARMLKMLNWHQLSYGYSITNVGRLDLPATYGEIQVKALYGPFFYSDVNEKFVGVTTMNGLLTFTMTYNEDLLGTNVAEHIRDSSLKQLHRVLGE